MASRKALLLLFAGAARSAAAATYCVASLAERTALRLSPGLEAVAAAASADAARLSGGRSATAAATVPTHGHGTAAPAPPLTHLLVPEPDGPDHQMICPSQVVGWSLCQKRRTLSQMKPCGTCMYERWCKAFDQKREPDEMARLFNKFKNRVLEIHSMNNANPSCKVGLTKFTDGKIAELRANRDRPQYTLAKKFSTPVSFIQRGDDKFLKEVFADFDVVNGKLFVYFPLENGKRHDKKEISTEYEVTRGCLFVADLPEAPELLIPTPEWIMRRHPPYFY